MFDFERNFQHGSTWMNNWSKSWMMIQGVMSCHVPSMIFHERAMTDNLGKNHVSQLSRNSRMTETSLLGLS